jgi:hypothetical protein
MKVHRFVLEPYKTKYSRHICPACGNRGRTFTLYIDIVTKEYLAHHVGRCGRENHCAYHYTPKQFFLDNPKSLRELKPYKEQKLLLSATPLVIPSFIPVELFKASLNCYHANHFVQFLQSHFGVAVTTQLIEHYYIGTSKYWNGACVFWQVDVAGRIRTGKVMQYSSISGKRVKEPYNHIQWVHKLLQFSDYGLKQCLFGEHLLKNSNKPVAIVESEKSALIASVFLPDFIWLATGSLNNLTADICAVLEGRKVVLFPDLNAFDKWSVKANEFAAIAYFSVSSLLELNASAEERAKGWDIADYLLKEKFINTDFSALDGGLKAPFVS